MSEERLETAIGPAEYLAVPVEAQGRSLGTFVVADYTAGEREQVDEAVRIVGAVAAGVLLLGYGGRLLRSSGACSAPARPA